MEAEYTAFGYDFPSARTRLDQLEEACVVVPGLLRNERFAYRGRHFWVDNASLIPRPVQERPSYRGIGHPTRKAPEAPTSSTSASTKVAARWCMPGSTLAPGTDRTIACSRRM